MRENFKRLQELLKGNTNIEIHDMEIYRANHSVRNKEIDSEMVDINFALIRKDKNCDLRCDFVKLRESGFEVVKIHNFEGRDEIHVKAMNELKVGDYCVITEDGASYKKGDTGYIQENYNNGNVEFALDRSDFEICCPLSVLKKI